MIFYYLGFGLVLGAVAGFSPGPLLILLISETLAHGRAAGIKVALAPMITDAPIVLLTYLLATKLSNIEQALGGVSLLGAAYVLYMAYHSFQYNNPASDFPARKNSALKKGVLTNALSPHPYVFWLSIGTPTIAKALQVSVVTPVIFIIGFYTMLLGAKIGLAILVARSKPFLQGRMYVYTLKTLAFILSLFAVLLIVDGVKMIAQIPR